MIAGEKGVMKREKQVILAVAGSAALGFGSLAGGRFPFWPAAAHAEERSSVGELWDAVETLLENGPQNAEAICVMSDQMIAVLGADSPAGQMLLSVQILLKNENVDWSAVESLIRTARESTEDSTEQLPTPETEDSTEQLPIPETEDSMEELPTPEEVHRESLGLPLYVADRFIWRLLTEQISLQVPFGWGDNASDSAVTSYSPVNGSGAISPGAGTLTTTHFAVESEDAQSAFAEYEQGISGMSVTADFSATPALAAGLPARRIQYIMNIGANRFTCEAVCFQYEKNLYAVELMQGQKSSFDYFPVFDNAVNTLQIGDAVDITQIGQMEIQLPEPETQAAEPETPVPEPETQAAEPETPVLEPETQAAESETQAAESETPVPEPELPEPETQIPESEGPCSTGDLGDFTYSIHGTSYSFPTRVEQLSEDALPIDRTQVLPYEFTPNREAGGLWNELSNTQYYFFENALFKEMAGITNMSGFDVPISQGMLTALIDLKGSDVEVVLPGGIAVESEEGAIALAFPEFTGAAMDGIAGFRGNDLLYACNVREDGCNGYVLIRNDAPYYSALSIICEAGVVREICFECLGSDRAENVFQ